MQTLDWNLLDSTQQSAILERPALGDSAKLSALVSDIIHQVKTQGDEAIHALTEKFDGLKLTNLRVSQAEIDASEDELGDEIKHAIQLAKAQIESFHQAQVAPVVKVETSPGVICELHTQPIESVGLYIPGGTAPLPSTVLMLATPARIAGCKRLVLTTPPGKDGKIKAEIRYAAKICQIDELYMVGGAQAIAALAYGTQSIKKVLKIFGPGNSFVTEAKQQVSQDHKGASIDMPAGPSEVLVIADEYANPEFVAADLLSQAEHGKDSQVILVTNSPEQAQACEAEVNRQVALLPRQEIAQGALSHSRIIITDSIAQSIAVSNQYAPEHLIVQTQDARALLPQLENAGSVFLGAFSPESAGDYASGTNHVLPTYGYTKTYSSLSLADFTKRYTVQELTAQGIQNIGPAIMHLAAAESLDAHKNAVAVRLQYLSQSKDGATS
ncbi:histidinol dehydrogenase [Catenovulum sp. 2E275]|uniref:histidinol dehydrogenase n=1 Tax=Catenovulum sp. 2E275 TaxID=2980497 RepID=UPI0021CF6C18|nr:histidinol dehydrogenase [Catenovulum sp. 2E275]MCU4677154.1 histidinol dehydrogenase [Catenovulum sp. 2E275]